MITVGSGVTTHLAQDTIEPVRLYQIGGTPILYYTDYDAPVYYNGQEYTPRGVTYNKTKLGIGYETENYNVSIDNIDDALISWALSNDPTGEWTYVYKAWLDGTQDGSDRYLPIDDEGILIFSGRNSSIRAQEEFELSIKTGLDLHRQRGPRVMQHKMCRFQGQDGFKGTNCGYAGAETECNYTWDRCVELANQERFGGFKDISSKQDS